MCCKLQTERILLLGGGGHASVVADTLRRINPNIQIGIVADDCVFADDTCTVVGTDADLPALLAEGWTQAFVAVGSVGNTSVRVKLASMLKELGFSLPAIIDPTSVVGSAVSVESGVYVGPRAVINAMASIEAFAIINSAAVVEHQCHIGAFAHISPGATLCGQVSVGAYTHVGARAVVRQGLTIGAHTVIGMGSVVTRDIADHAIAHGCPCRVQRKVKE